MILKQVPNAEHALGAMRVGINIEAVAFMPAFGLMISAQALVGQSLGMKDPDRARRLGWLCAHHSAAVVGFVSILLAAFAPQVANAMLEGQSQEVIHIAVMYTYIILATEVLFSYGMVLVGAMQGAGDMVRPFWQTVITLWGVRLPLAACLALPAGWIPGMPGWALGATGVWWAMSVSQTLNGLMAMYQWKQGAWQAARV
jgi:Na+-driven multidrug efflux pump